MAAIDFPAAPADGALFRPSLTGITYQFSASPSPGLWKPVQSGTSPGGDFMATHSSLPVTVGAGTLVFNTVTLGNVGNWYSVSTGRYTPPPGRYFLFTGYYGPATGSGQSNVSLRKNGVAIPNASALVSNPAGLNSSPQISCVVDANGTDFFDVQGFSSAGLTAGAAWFGAYPLSGIQGPPGPVNTGQLTLFSEQVLVAPANQIAVTIPVQPRLVRLVWGTGAASGVNESLSLQIMQGATPFAAANYDWQHISGSTTTAFAGQGLNQTNWNVGGGVFHEGYWECSTLSAAGAPFNSLIMGTVQDAEIGTGGGRVMRNFSTYIQTVAASSVTGFRLIHAGTLGNFLAGSYLRAFVVP